MITYDQKSKTSNQSKREKTMKKQNTWRGLFGWERRLHLKSRSSVRLWILWLESIRRGHKTLQIISACRGRSHGSWRQLSRVLLNSTKKRSPCSKALSTTWMKRRKSSAAFSTQLPLSPQMPSTKAAPNKVICTFKNPPLNNKSLLPLRRAPTAKKNSKQLLLSETDN